MKCRDLEHLLVELADGTLRAEDKPRVEEHIARCAGCAADAALLRETFAVLRTDADELPPEHYFSTLLPRVRTRLENKERAWGLFLPAWLAKATAPLTVSAMTLVLVALFRAFEPSSEELPLHSIVAEVPGEEIASLVVTPTEQFSGEFGLPSSEKLLEAMPNANTLAETMKSELLAGELPFQQTEVGVQTVEKTVDVLDDETVSLVLDRMNESSTL